jgi:hypothetical protein
MEQKKKYKELDVDSIGNQELLSKEEENLIREFIRKKSSPKRKRKIIKEKFFE